MGLMWRREWTHRRITAGARALRPRETADSMASADDGKGVVLSLLRTREGSNILAEAYHYVCHLHFEILTFQGRGSRRGKCYRSRGDREFVFWRK